MDKIRPPEFPISGKAYLIQYFAETHTCMAHKPLKEDLIKRIHTFKVPDNLGDESIVEFLDQLELKDGLPEYETICTCDDCNQVGMIHFMRTEGGKVFFLSETPELKLGRLRIKLEIAESTNLSGVDVGDLPPMTEAGSRQLQAFADEVAIKVLKLIDNKNVT